jgi:hypothetical protein
MFKSSIMTPIIRGDSLSTSKKTKYTTSSPGVVKGKKLKDSPRSAQRRIKVEKPREGLVS